MIDVMENIKKLSAALDAETASLHPSGKLLLLGSQDSVFLKAIKRKADQLGINCDHTSNPLPPYRGYDYWNLVNNILPAIKEDVMEHHGCLAIRGDSGNPVEIVTETVFKLWEIFGGTVNSKGYKVLDPHVKALYGDSITPQRCEAVYKILMEHGFAINNVSLGVGSFSMQCLETMDGGEKTYAPYTRDIFGIAVKATYAEDADGKPIMIFKNPKTDSGHFKKSQRGCCKVVYDYTYHNFFCQDGLTWEESQVGNWLQPVFKDGKLLKIYTLDEVRKNLHEGNF